MPRLLGALLAIGVTSCSGLPQVGPVPTPPIDDCWFLEGQPIGREGFTTLGALGMGGRDGRWDDVRVYAWITKDEIDLWGGAEMTRAVCTVTEDLEYVEAMDGDVGWNEFPVINGRPDSNDDPP